MEQALNPNVYGVKIKERREQNAELIKSTESMLTVSFREVSNLDFIEEIHLELGTRTDASLEILIKLKMVDGLHLSRYLVKPILIS